MPFRVSETDDSLPRPLLRVAGNKTFELVTPFQYVDPATGRAIDVPAHSPGSTTDLASVPGLLWGFVAPYGRQLLPALMHDARCDLARVTPPGSSPSAAEIRADADRMFREALDDRGVPWLRRWLIWSAVTLQGRLRHDRRAFVRDVALLVLLAVAAVAGVRDLDGWARLVPLATPAALGLLAPRSFAVAALGLYGAPLAGAVLAVNVTVGVLVWLVPTGAVWLLRCAYALAARKPLPDGPAFGPTAVFRRRAA